MKFSLHSKVPLILLVKLKKKEPNALPHLLLRLRHSNRYPTKNSNTRVNKPCASHSNSMKVLHLEVADKSVLSPTCVQTQTFCLKNFCMKPKALYTNNTEQNFLWKKIVSTKPKVRVHRRPMKRFAQLIRLALPNLLQPTLTHNNSDSIPSSGNAL